MERLRPRVGAAWSPWLLVVGAVCLGVPVLVAALTGNLAIPHNDAWSMSRIAQTFATTGQIHLLGWNDMNLIGQVVMLGPLGASLVVQQLAVAALSLVCLAGCYRLLAVSLSTRDAVLGTVLLGLWPGWASLSTSFETDVPAFAATFAALLLGRRALRRDSAGWLAAALLVSLWAVSIREQAIVAPIAIIGCAWLTRDSRRRLGARSLAGAAGAALVLLAGFELWRWGLPLGQDPGASAGAPRFVGDLFACAARSSLTLAVVLSPAVLLGAARRRWVRRDLRWLAVGALMAGMAMVCGGVVGHYLSRSGEYAQDLPGTRVVIPGGAWDALIALGCVSAALFVPVARERWRSVDPLLGLFTVLAFAEIVVIGAMGNGVSDRYLPALLPGLVTCLLARPRGSARAELRPGTGAAGAAVLRGTAIVALGCVALVSALLALNADAFDAARWHTAQRIASTGVPATRIAAGLEWTGWHSPNGLVYPAALTSGAVRRPGGWELAFSRAPACVVLAPSPLPLRAPAAAAAGETGWTSAGSVAYRTFLVAGSSRLYAYRTHVAGCRA